MLSSRQSYASFIIIYYILNARSLQPGADGELEVALQSGSRELPYRLPVLNITPHPPRSNDTTENILFRQPASAHAVAVARRSQLVENERGLQGEFAGTVRSWSSETVYSGTWNTRLGRGSIP